MLGQVHLTLSHFDFFCLPLPFKNPGDYIGPTGIILILRISHLALAGVAQWTEYRPVNQRVIGLIPSQGAHAWVAGQVPSRARLRDNHTLMFLSLSFPSPLSKNK